MEIGVVIGVIAIGFVHGVLPDHGWPIAAMYALNRNRRLLYGLFAALVLGVGHLISSVVLVAAYYGFSSFAAFAEGPWLEQVAGVLLILLGIHEYRHGGHGHGHVHDHEDHDHDHGHEHDHGHDPADHDGERSHDAHDHGHTHEHEHEHEDETDHPHDHHTDGGSDAPTMDTADSDSRSGVLERLRARFPGGGHQHLSEEHAERGLAALGTTALLLGFAHEEPIQILAICVGTPFCLELMLLYSLAVIVAIVVPTLLLIAGYERHRERVERITPHLPAITAVALVGMGLAFLTGLV
ncbi:ABC transporter permease [Halobiforma lacisalsi AJ5]|uniref:ABC transporter permease n=1 Tax=Natronobacterium lacisalsi AJ5 TaxID=358396 RepID=M0LQB3_NATLA|nr:hypothetical protein [Halobiforma lacisalsi]APW96929.1 ABC transporter permease [Halobiforma lacisalsi AJ5]EMA34639.1 hypothetical protein C445_06955 [Halobiforma lacisalsi AJ5]